MQETAKVPFPILPTAIQIASLLAGLYPLFDIEDDGFLFKRDDAHFQLSLQALGLGCCFLFLGYYTCQFITSVTPLRREYLGALALCTGLHAALAALRAVFNPSTVAAAAASTAVLGLVAGSAVAVLLVYDKTAAPNPWVDKKEPQVPQDEVLAAQRRVRIATHVLWALAAIAYHLPYMPPAVQAALSRYLGAGLTAQLEPVYVLGGAVATDLAAVARLWSFVGALLRERKAKNVKQD